MEKKDKRMSGIMRKIEGVMEILEKIRIDGAAF
jgi:hypothetical protein